MYPERFFTHKRCTFTHKRCTKCLQRIDYKRLPKRPVVPLWIPIWIACSSATALWKSAWARQIMREPPPPQRGKGATRHRDYRRTLGMCGPEGRSSRPFSWSFDLQFGVDHDYPSEGLDGFASKAGAALRRFGIPGSEAPAHRLPGNQRGPRQVADPARRPGVEIERQRRLLESLDGPQVERHRSGNKLLEKVRRKVTEDFSGRSIGNFCGVHQRWNLSATSRFSPPV